MHGGVLERGKEERQTGSRVTTEAQMTWPQAKEELESPGAGGDTKEPPEGLLWDFGSADASTSDLQPPEPCGGKSVLFRPPRSVGSLVICYSSHRELAPALAPLPSQLGTELDVPSGVQLRHPCSPHTGGWRGRCAHRLLLHGPRALLVGGALHGAGGCQLCADSPFMKHG